MAITSKPRALTLAAAATIPSDIAGRLLADVDGIARRMTRQIIADSQLRDPGFRTLSYLRTLTEACRDAVRTLIRLLNDGRGLRQGDLTRLGSMGAQQAELGVPLEVVFGAYRVAAKVVWQDLVAEPALLDQLTPAAVVGVTGIVLQYLDEISAAVGSAYLATRERLMRQRDRDRDRLLQRLLAGDASEELRRLAASIGLELSPPYRVLAAAIEAGTEDHMDSTWRREDLLATSDGPGVWLVLASPNRDVESLRERIPCAAIGVGPIARTLEDVGAAAADARRALQVGTLLDPSHSLHDDELVGVFAVAAGDSVAASRFVQRTLGPVMAQRPSRRAELLETIECLVTTDNVAAAASRLGVHRHTVVYRMERLRELGVRLDSAEDRHAAWLALRCMRLLPKP